MEIKNINGIRVLTPSAGMWLCDQTAHIVSDEVWLGKEDTPDRWEEITTEEKEALEAKWAEEAEAEAERPTPDPYEVMRKKAAAYDLIARGEENV